MKNGEMRGKLDWFLDRPLVAEFNVDPEGKEKKRGYVGGIIASSAGIFLTPTLDRESAPAALEIRDELAGYPDGLEVFLYSFETSGCGWLGSKPVAYVYRDSIG